MVFEPFPKLARLNRTIVITEKLDGTNAQVYNAVVTPTQEEFEKVMGAVPLLYTYTPDGILIAIYAGSRSKLIYPGKTSDNAGFAKWVFDNGMELAKLGPGRHFGEWWGAGIQRGYGLKEKRFSLFNRGRWNEENVPACVSVVPKMYEGPFSEEAIKYAIEELKREGSKAAPGFMNPEGVVVYHSAADLCFKVTCEKDESPKSLTS